MAARKKLTRLARIGMTHSERARAMAAKGMYSEALSELKIALFSLRSENRDGSLNDDIAGVLNSIGSVNLLLRKYTDAAQAFSEAAAIRRPIYNNPEVAGSLIGLAEAHRCVCHFSEASECLEEALQVALTLKNDGLAARVMDAMDTLERTRDNKPAHGNDAAGCDCYLPPELEGVHAVLRNLELDVSPEMARISLVLGFPGLDRSLDSRIPGNSSFPCAAVFLEGKESTITSLSVIDEEEEPVEAAATPFDGLVFAPGSYHRDGPKPVPSCKKLTFAGGAGALLQWKIAANGWYRAEIGLKPKDVPAGFKAAVVLPYHVRMNGVFVDVRRPLEYGLLRIDEGTFFASGSPDRIARGHGIAFAFKRRLFEGSAFGALNIEAGSSLKHAVISLELRK
ncbi:MAG: Tetratricopeptide repeat protein [Methanocella sp. PtaU1.Bin125]|nr:MAG: Tetratricopeptide repeat protein [Methanocella sp. PtaU1.Bin125]